MRIFDFEEAFGVYDVVFEIYVGNSVRKQRMQAPKEMIQLNFIQTVNQIAEDSRPTKIRMVREVTIWDKFENKQKTLENVIEFRNNAMGWD